MFTDFGAWEEARWQILDRKPASTAGVLETVGVARQRMTEEDVWSRVDALLEELRRVDWMLEARKLWEWQEELDKHSAELPGECDGCDTTMLFSELIQDDRLPKKHFCYCAECLEEVRSVYRRMCLWCGQEYYVRNRNTRAGVCDKCDTVSLAMELGRVKQELSRARAAGAEASLTLDRWMVTVDHFERRCAYCGKYPFEVMEHVVRIPEGGTTWDNCVPACSSCNASKSSKRLHEWCRWPGVDRGKIDAVIDYLAGLEPSMGGSR